MGKRSTSRRLAMQALYQADLANSEIATALENVTEGEPFIPETIEFATALAEPCWQQRADLDKLISEFSIDWPIDRIGKVDRSILRLAFYELKLGETPRSVIINEAVELAKKYSSAEASRFINGILGAFVKQE
ncbi:MAG: transcription antitermination factor NusB [bacterium]